MRLVQESRDPRPYDVATRELIDTDPAAWLRWAGLPVDGPVTARDSEVSTVLAEVDKVLQVDSDRPWMAHLEVQASRDHQLPLRLLQYHALLLRRHDLPLASVVVLLRSQADVPELTGELTRSDPTGEPSLSFRYRVIRLWQRPAEELLTGGLGVLPLAPLTAVRPENVPTIIERMTARLDQEASPDLARNLWAATLVLLGLRYDEREANHLLRGVRQMRESTTYQAILREGRSEGHQTGLLEGREEGRASEARRLLLRMAEHRFGPPTPGQVAAIEAITDIE